MWKYFRDKGPQEIVKNILHLPLVFLLWIFLEILRLNRHVFVVNLGHKGRITHYMLPMELHLRNANRMNRKYVMIFVMPASTPNEAVRTLYRRYSVIIDSHFPKFVRRTFSILIHLLESRFSPKLPSANKLWILNPATNLSDQEIQFGARLRKKLGIPDDADYVCLSVKDGAYYLSVTLEEGYGQDLRHQADDPRNPDINNYLLAANYLAEKGIYVIRMGSVVSAPLSRNRHEKIIDYASYHRSELGDIVLYRNCLFELNGTAGSFVFAASANKPIVEGDDYEMDGESLSNHTPREVLTLSLIKESAGERLLSIREIVKLGKQGWHYGSIRNLGLERRNNTEEEILAAVRELEDFILGDLTLTRENKKLQEEFYECLGYHLDRSTQSLPLISPSFLAKFRELL